jgi:hypothetical protein
LRQTVLGRAAPAGSGRLSRLDPLALPVRFTADDAVADGRVRHVEIDRNRVRLSRSLRGMTMRFTLPVEAYLGVALRLAPTDGQHEGAVVLRLEHRDAALSVELFADRDNSDVVAEWRLWGQVLGLPLLVADCSGTLREPFPRLGVVALAAPGRRRRRRNAIKKRRPSFPLRRRVGATSRARIVHREREIIARN